MKHTPGPWKEERCHAANIVDVYDGHIIREGDGWRIPNGINLICTVAHVGTAQATNANARLIAAAPELLEACKRALVYVKSDPAVYPLICCLEEAIAKATGKEG